MGPTWGPSGSCRSQMGPMLTPWTLLSGWCPALNVRRLSIRMGLVLRLTGKNLLRGSSMKCELTSLVWYIALQSYIRTKKRDIECVSTTPSIKLYRVPRVMNNISYKIHILLYWEVLLDPYQQLKAICTYIYIYRPQSRTVITRSNIVRYCMNYCRNSCRTSIRCWTQKDPPPPPHTHTHTHTYTTYHILKWV